jgi:hypothetical protein
MSQLHLFRDRTSGREHELWYSSDDIDKFHVHATICSETIKTRLSQGSSDVELDHILGLERLLNRERYLIHRQELIKSVMEEQHWQRLAKQMRLMKGFDEDNIALINSMILANVSISNSSYAREDARAVALALEQDVLNRGKSSSR